MEWVGWAAAILTTVSFVPQAVKVIQTRDTASISLWMYILFATGIACWLAYGLLIGDVPMTAANAITLILATIILVTKVRNG
jgi:MtN3 and saliva related transmembrane protein